MGKVQIEWRKARNASIKGIEFPFPYRKGQRACGICLPDDSSEEKVVYPGTNRSGEDDFNGISGSESGWRKNWVRRFLIDGKDNHPDGGGYIPKTYGNRI